MVSRVWWLGVLGGVACSNPANVEACLDAQAVLADAWEACGTRPGVDLACDRYGATARDCTAYFDDISATAACDSDGQVTYEAGGCDGQG